MLDEGGKYDQIGDFEAIVRPALDIEANPEVGAFDQAAENDQLHIQSAQSVTKLVASLPGNGRRWKNDDGFFVG